MNTWINLSALWKTVVFGLVAGAGLPALFAIGLFSLSRGPKLQPADGTADAESDAVVGGSAAGMAVAGICFLIVLAAIAWGIYQIYVTGHPKK